MKRALLALLLAVTLVASASGTATAQNLDYKDDGGAPQAHIDVGTWTRAEYDMGWDGPLEYENNSGEVVSFPGYINATDAVDAAHNNPFSVIATDINATDFGEFPRKDAEEDNSASALDASEWTVATGAGSSSDVTTAATVDAVEWSTNGTMSDTNVAEFEYANFTISSDIDNRYIQVGADVDTLDSAAVVELRAVESDGDYRAVELANASAEESSSTVMANATGEGDVIQVQMGDLSTQGTGDGSLAAIDKLVIHVEDADATIQASLVNLERQSPYTFGAERVDSDGDDELETNDLTEPHGRYSMHALDSMGPTFSDAVLRDLQAPVSADVQNLPDSDVRTFFNETETYPAFDVLAHVEYRLGLPDDYDLSYSDVDVVAHTTWPGERYVEVTFKEGVGDTDFADIDGTTTKTSSFDAEDSNVTLDDTVSPGTEYYLGFKIKLTSAEADDMQSTGGGGGGAATQEPQGLLDRWIVAPISGAIVALLSFLGLRSR